jgi:diaminopimelate epimerase
MVFIVSECFNNNLTHMQIPFNKYQGAGNDFVMIDNRKGIINPDDSVLINKLCDRRFGIGADGLILISPDSKLDFEMKYFNSDGKIGSMCGNGGRCTAHFANKLGLAGNKMKFLAFDGPHEAELKNGIVRLQMSDIKTISKVNGNYFINTGSPHYIVFVKNAKETDVFNEGKRLRWSEDFKPGGTNVNFVEIIDSGIFVRTFERGVEDETLACGTGVTASAIASVLAGHFDTNHVNVKALGGDLSVEFKITNDIVTNVYLSGPATFVFEGVIEV